VKARKVPSNGPVGSAIFIPARIHTNYYKRGLLGRGRTYQLSREYELAFGPRTLSSFG